MTSPFRPEGFHLSKNTQTRSVTTGATLVGSDLAFKLAMHKFGIAIGAFDIALFPRNLQPDARMTQRALAAITSHAIGVNNSRFWGLRYHGGVSFCVTLN
jgi:hypothetical protein